MSREVISRVDVKCDRCGVVEHCNTPTEGFVELQVDEGWSGVMSPSNREFIDFCPSCSKSYELFMRGINE